MLLSSLFLVLLFSFSGQEHKIANQADFDRLATTRFEPGDRILFKRGQRFEGAFAPTGNGTKEAPIVIGSYGSCLLYTSPSPRDKRQSRMPSSA